MEPNLTDTVNVLIANSIDISTLQSGHVTQFIPTLPLTPGAIAKVLSLCPPPPSAAPSAVQVAVNMLVILHFL